MTQQEIDDIYGQVAHMLQINKMCGQVMQSRTRFIASREEELNRELRKELRKVIFAATLTIFAMIGSRARLK
ncbi:hypothetical protein [Wolbachia endosymbiont of Tetranychus urticae]|uniref:hypothetical protein n=1 Tax=Wolbachia endosymbiont of Tetranychus urticae TaxID=169184 RepID=UPI00397DBC1E